MYIFHFYLSVQLTAPGAYISRQCNSRAEARASKWKRMKNKSFIRLPSSRCRYPRPTLPPRQLFGVSDAPPVPEAPPLATRDLLYLHQGQKKRAGKMTARRRMREIMRGDSFESNGSESSAAECSDSD